MCLVFGHGRILEHHALQDIPDEKLFFRRCWDFPLRDGSAALALPRSAFMLPSEPAPMFLRHARTARRLEPLDSSIESIQPFESIALLRQDLSCLAFLSFLAAGGLMLLANIG